MFNALREWVVADGFRGCVFIKASAEFQKKEDAINRQSYAHKELLLDHFGRLTEDVGNAEPRILPRQLRILKEGAIVIAAMSHSRDTALEAKEITTQILAPASRVSSD